MEKKTATQAQIVLSGVIDTHARLDAVSQVSAGIVDPSGTVVESFGAPTDTVFRIASMTKSFTAAAILQLRDAGQITLDEPIATYAPELASVVGPGVDPATITLRHLLSMSSGLVNDDPWADRHLDASDSDLDKWVGDGLRFAYPTGTTFEYSNLGYALAARVVLRATGTTVQELVSRQILEPLGMTNTFWELPNGFPESRIAHGWHPIDGSQSQLEPLGDGVIAPMGGLWSTVADLAIWVAFFSSAFGEQPTFLDVLRPSSRREMQKVQQAFAPQERTSPDGRPHAVVGGYGFGLNALHDQTFGTVITHSGGLPGYGSNMRWIPGGTGLVSLANVTYARMTFAAKATLDALHANNVVNEQHNPGALPGSTALTELTEVSNNIVRLINVCADDQQQASDFADSIFADNMNLDTPFSVLCTELAALAPATLVTTRAVHGAEGEAIIMIDQTRFGTITFSLAPIQPALIQHLTITPKSTP